MVLEIPPADDGVINGTIMHLAGAALGCRAGRRRQGQGRQVSGLASLPSGRCFGRLHRFAFDELSRLRVVTLNSQERERC